jgi:hypothetical protein
MTDMGTWWIGAESERAKIEELAWDAEGGGAESTVLGALGCRDSGMHEDMLFRVIGKVRRLFFSSFFII